MTKATIKLNRKLLSAIEKFTREIDDVCNELSPQSQDKFLLFIKSVASDLVTVEEREEG